MTNAAASKYGLFTFVFSDISFVVLRTPKIAIPEITRNGSIC